MAWVPDAEVMFSGDLIEYHSACYCGDAHLREWPMTLNEIRAFNPKAIAPGRGDATLESVVDASNLALFCSPAINLFSKRADRIHVGESSYEYHVVPDWLDINNWVSLGVIVVVLTVTTVVSLAKARRDERKQVAA